MGVRDDCRHYLHRSTPNGEAIQRCRVSANEEAPFACPDGCLFFEARALMGAGWAQAPSQPMTNTADALNALPPLPKRKRPRKRG
jgi:hypothetical protein